MKKLTKFGIITMSVFVLNLVSQSVVQADETNSETANVSVTLGNTNSTDAENTSSVDNMVASDPTSDTSLKSDEEDVNASSPKTMVAPAPTSDTSLKSDEEGANASSPKTEEISTNSEATTGGKEDSTGSNIIDEGGYVNVEGLPAHFSEDGKSVVYNYTVVYKAMHSSDHGQSVSDLQIRFPNIPNAKVDFTLVGTRDKKENPVSVNAPMKKINYDDENRPYPTVIPRAEELAAGRTPFVVGYEGSPGLVGIEFDKVTTYTIYTLFTKSQAVRVSITIPLEEAKKIKYLPLDARMDWKSSQEGGGSYEEGSQSLQEYHNHTVGFLGSDGNQSFGGLENPALIDDSYVKNDHLIKSVANPNTYITPNNGDWTTIPHDTNINPDTFFNYVNFLL